MRLCCKSTAAWFPTSNSGVLVVDNDPKGSAQSVAEGRDSRIGYVAEPTPGIAASRNRALAVLSELSAVIFVDDDEVPEAGWLDSLIVTWRRWRADAVAGRVVSKVPEAMDPWIVSGRFFERLSHKTGTKVQVAATNNLLLDMGFVRRFGLVFDNRFGLTGGSDTLFRLGGSWRLEAP